MAGRELGDCKDGQGAAWRSPYGEAEASQLMLGDVFDFFKESVLHPGARMRQAEVLADGLAIGGLKEVPNQILNHTGETAWKALGSTVAGVGFGVALGSANKFLKAGAGAVSSLMLGAGILHELNGIVSDRKLAGALDSVWKNGDAETLRKAKQVGEAELGGKSFEIGLGVICGTAGGVAGGFGIKRLELGSGAAKGAACVGDTCEIGWKPGKPPEFQVGELDGDVTTLGIEIPKAAGRPGGNIEPAGGGTEEIGGAGSLGGTG